MKQHNFPTLYKLTSTGAVQGWVIDVIETEAGGLIDTTFGHVDSDKPQTTHDLIAEGKNIGKTNETTPYEQAYAEALSRWTLKKTKNGYVESIEAAKAGGRDELVLGGIDPMLAHSFAKQGHKIKYPAYVSPKLDGHRCIAVVQDGVCTLWSRTRKPINSVPHINMAIERLAAGFGLVGDLVLDGELYQHEYRNKFEELTSFIRQDSPALGHEVVQYHVYDIESPGSYYERLMAIRNLLGFRRNEPSIVCVSSQEVLDEDAAMSMFEQFVDLGYEGAMIRNFLGGYENKRSYNLQKIKEFEEAEFDIVGVEEGRGKLAGHAIFVCRTDKGVDFRVKATGDTAKLKEYFENHELWTGKQLTVKYQGITTKNGVPRFPVGVRIREDV